MIFKRKMFNKLLVAMASMVLVSCGAQTAENAQNAEKEKSAVTQATTSATTPAEDGTSPSGDFKVKKGKHVLFSTTKGDIEVILYDNTPKHRDNFLKLVKENKYDSLLFHRVIPNFMIQSGDPDSKNAPAGKGLGFGSVGEEIDAEIYFPHLYHKRGALAAARKGDAQNPKKKSSPSQFYIVWGNVYSDVMLTNLEVLMSRKYNRSIKFNDELRKVYTTLGGVPDLDGAYTVFGEITEESFKTVEAIQSVKCDANDRPLEDVRILKATVLE